MFFLSWKRWGESMKWLLALWLWVVCPLAAQWGGYPWPPVCGKPPGISSGVGFRGSYFEIQPISKIEEITIGALWGVDARLLSRDPRAGYGQISGFWDKGKSTKGGFPTVETKRFEAEVRAGYTFSGCEGYLLLSPYAGVGWRSLNSYIRAGANDILRPLLIPLDRRYRTCYLPVGFLFTTRLLRALEFGVSFQIEPALHSTFKSKETPGVCFTSNTRLSWSLEIPVMVGYCIRQCGHNLPQVWQIECTFLPFFQKTGYGRVGILEIPRQYQISGGINFLFGVRV